MAPQRLVPRDSTTNQGAPVRDDDYDGDGWYADKAVIIKWAVVAAIVLVFIIYFLGGYIHAQRRIKKGLPPLAYHKWLLPTSQRRQYAPRPHFTFQQPSTDGYNMNEYPPPPPAYNAANAAPPSYQPPQGASKTNPDQGYASPPPGPPPAHRPLVGGDLGEGPVPQAEPATPLPTSKAPNRFQKILHLRK